MDRMEILNWVLSVVTLVASGGWFINYRANKRKSEGEAAQEEAAGWKAMQEVYEQHIEDMKNMTNDVREDIERLREDKKILVEENKKWRQKYDNMEEQIRELKNSVARLGRKLETVLPFSCSIAGCPNRLRVEVQDNVKQ